MWLLGSTACLVSHHWARIHNDSRQLRLLSTGIIKSTTNYCNSTCDRSENFHSHTWLWVYGDDQHGASCLSVFCLKNVKSSEMLCRFSSNSLVPFDLGIFATGFIAGFQAVGDPKPDRDGQREETCHVGRWAVSWFLPSYSSKRSNSVSFQKSLIIFIPF